jgi:hypothetical protein
MRIHVRKARVGWIALLAMVVMIVGAWAGPGITTSHTGTFTATNGSWSPQNNGVYKTMGRIAANSTWKLNVAGYESIEPSSGIKSSITTNGGGTMTLDYIGSQPSQVICSHCSFSYNGYEEVVTYQASLSDTLSILWNILPSPITALTEPQTVLLSDDFLYPGPLIDGFWTMDQYNSPGSFTGEYTSSGYLVMSANASNGNEAVHTTSSIYNPGSYSNDTAVKRKMTVALIPFSQGGPNTVALKIGFSSLLSTGSYPGNTPYNTPYYDTTGLCNADGGANDRIGSEYIYMNNVPGATSVACGDGGTSFHTFSPTGLSPTSYTVFTVETFGIFCTSASIVCADNALAGTSWVWFRLYQEDSKGKITYDQSFNSTTGVAPLYQKLYAFIYQFNDGSSGSHGVSKIDFVEIQNYGSPVCLVAPGGFLCTRLPSVPNSILGGNGIVGLFAWLANQIGFGDEQAGAIILFFGMFVVTVAFPFFIMRSIEVGAGSFFLELGFFVYTGFLPIWVLVIVFLGLAAVIGMIVMKVMSGSVQSSREEE